MKEETKIKRMNEYVESKGIALKILLKYILRDKDLTFERKRQITYKDYTHILNAMEEYKELSERQTPTEAKNNLDTKQLIIADVSGSAFLTSLLSEIKQHEREIISDPHRFTGISTAELERVFDKHGVKMKIPF